MLEWAFSKDILITALRVDGRAISAEVSRLLQQSRQEMSREVGHFDVW